MTLSYEQYLKNSLASYTSRFLLTSYVGLITQLLLWLLQACERSQTKGGKKEKKIQNQKCKIWVKCQIWAENKKKKNLEFWQVPQNCEKEEISLKRRFLAPVTCTTNLEYLWEYYEAMVLAATPCIHISSCYSRIRVPI